MKELEDKRKQFILLVCIHCIFANWAQDTNLKGKIIDQFTLQNLEGVLISIEETSISTKTNTEGIFIFDTIMIPAGNQILRISKDTYVTKRFPVTIDQNQISDLGTIELSYDLNEEQALVGTISLSDNELEEDENNSVSNVSGLLRASRDVFLRAAAFDFSAAFFRPKGFGSEYSKVWINGIEMNKLVDGRPQWSNWGGLNDVQRNQEFTIGIALDEFTFGDIAGTTHITMRASQYRKGSRISYATSNRTYTNRVMATYNSGIQKSGWAYSFSMSRRFGEEGYINGTVYDANSFFASIEKKINAKHSLNFTGFYTPNRRGRSTALTNEVLELRGRNYNPNWGYLEEDKKNSRIREIKEPVFILNHYWQLSDNTSIHTNIGYQTGSIGNSRLDNGGTDLITLDGQNTFIGGGVSANTNPIHHSNLPSYYLRFPNPSPLDYQNAFLAQQTFQENGQLDWQHLIRVNQNNAELGKNATYIRFEDRQDERQLTFSTHINSKISDRLDINSTINFRNAKSENYAQVLDLLGGSGFLDVDAFGVSFGNSEVINGNFSSEQLANRSQSDLQNPNRIVQVGDRYDYNYEIDAQHLQAFAQAQYTLDKADLYLGMQLAQTQYQRNGLFDNGYFTNSSISGSTSLGQGDKLSFTNYGIKTGITYKINGRQAIDIHTAYLTKAPTVRNSYANARQNHLTIAEVMGGTQENEKIQSVDIGYIWRSPKVKARVTSYYTRITDATDISFFFTQSLLQIGDGANFVQEILTDIDKIHLGGELGIEYQITPTVKLKTAAAIGQFTYGNHPQLAIAGSGISSQNEDGSVSAFIPQGVSYLKNYHLAQGPERVAQLGFEYRDPDFWWIGASSNYFSHSYLDSNPLARTANFNQDIDGLPFVDYDPDIARTLLRQEQLDDYVLINLVGGKSWRIKKYAIGFFASINNVLDTQYITGGFEQARAANYRQLVEESQRKIPVFGNRYFLGTGTSYYLNLYFRF